MKEKILHYAKQKFSPEMMVKKKKMKVGISTIYYWFHNGHLGLTVKRHALPQKRKRSRSKPVLTLNQQANQLKIDLKLLIFATRKMVIIMKLIQFY